MPAARPDPAAAEIDELALGVRLSKALGRLERPADELREFGGTLGRTHPFVFGWYYAARDAQRKGHPSYDVRDPIEIVKMVRRSRQRANSTRRWLDFEIDVSDESAGLERTLESLADSLGQPPATVELVPLDARQRRSLAASAKLVRQVWPDMASEVDATVRRLALVRAKGIVGFSHLETHGAIFINVERLDDPDVFAEELIHEASHVRLNALAAMTPIIRDREDQRLYFTPLRVDPRPLIGAFHQMFVLARLFEFALRACALDNAPSRRERLEKHEADLRVAFAVMSGDPPLTDAGRKVLREAESIIAQDVSG